MVAVASTADLLAALVAVAVCLLRNILAERHRACHLAHLPPPVAQRQLPLAARATACHRAHRGAPAPGLLTWVMACRQVVLVLALVLALVLVGLPPVAEKAS